MTELYSFYRAVIVRETRKLLRQRDRLSAAMVRPVLWLWVIGGGMQALAGPGYTARLLPGIVGMTVLFGGMVGGLSLAFDRDAGTMRLLVTSPVRQHHILIVKSLAAAVAALVQAGLLLLILGALEVAHWLALKLGLDLSALFPWLGKTEWPSLLWLFIGLALSSVACGTLGVLCGTFAKSIDGFAVMMNFVIFPLFFFSGALYPTAPMPYFARLLSQLNPFTYCVDLLRHAFHSHAEFNAAYSVMVLCAATLLMLVVACWQFSRQGAVIPLRK